MVEQQTRRTLRCGGRYFGARVNCESVPCLPARSVARALRDPRGVPYLLVWQDSDTGAVKEAVRVIRYGEPGPCDWTGWIEIKRTNGTHTLVRTVERALPRNGGKALLLVCPYCQQPCRALYGWELNRMRTHSVFLNKWQCRVCAGLRYASEGGALIFRSRSSLAWVLDLLLGTSRPRPEPWEPLVLTSPAQAAELGLCQNN